MPLFGEIVVIKRNGSDGTHFPLTATTCLFGRKTECDIRIQLTHVSKEHCKVEVKENKEVFATNLSTVNPTQLNGKVIQQPVRLKHGDVLTIIDRSFRFEEPRSKPARRRSTGLGSETYQVSASEQSANIDETVRVETPKTSKRLRKSEGSFTKMTHDRRSLQISSSRDNKDSSPFSELYEMLKSKVESKKAKSPLKQAGRSPRNTKSESILQAVNYPQPTVTSRRSFTRSQASDAYGETPIVVGGQDKTGKNKHQLIENTDAVAMDKAHKDSHIGQEAPGGGETNKKLRTPEKSSSPQFLSSQTPSSNSTFIPYDDFISMLGREDESENKRSPKQSLNSEQVKSATKVFSPRNTKSGVSPRQRKMKESASVLSGKEISESISEDSQLQHFDKSHTQGRGRGSLSGQIQKHETVNKSSPKTELIAHEDLNTSPLSRRLSRKSVRNASPKALDLTESTATKKSPRKRRSDELSLPEPPMKRKRVSFGGHLSPELFDKRLPPNSPLKRGATPARRSLSIDLPRAVIRKSFGLKHSLLQEISEQSGSSSRVASSGLISGKGTPVSSPAKRSPAKATPAKSSPARANTANVTPAKKSPLRASPAKTTPAKRSPPRASPAKTTPAKRSPLRASPAKTTPAKRSPLRASPAKATPAKRSPLRASPAKATPAKRSPLRASPAKATPAKRSPLRASPAKATPAKRSPLRASPAKATPAKRSPLRASPAKATPAKRSPLRASPAKATPAKRSPLRASPAKATPAKRSPLRASPAKATPAKRSPLRASPAKATPAKRSPLRASPAKATPAKRSPLRASPAKATPAKRSPLRASPAKATPAKRSPLRASPAKATPAKRSPLRASPAKATPAKRSPAKATPAKRSPLRASPAKATPAKRSPLRASPAKATPAKRSPLRASPAKATPAKRSPLRASHAKATPAKRSPLRASPAKATPAKRSPLRASPAKATPAKRSPLRASPAKATPAKRSPLRASPAKATPAKRSPLRASPAKATPAKRSPLRASPAKATPAKRSPLRASPAKATPAKRSPLRASPAKATPAKRSPLRASPAKATPAKRSPLRASPAKATPAKRSPLRASPAKATPAKRSPLRASPAKATPAKRSPLRASPAKATPAKRSPLRASPAKATPAKRSPLRASPAKATPAKRSPLRASPAKATPAKRSPLRASPAKATPAKRSPLRASPAKATPAKRSPARPSLAMESLVVRYTKGRFSVSRINTPPQVDIVAVDAARGSFTEQTPNKSRKSLTLKKTPLRRSRKLNAIEVIRSRRRSGATEANLLLAKSWAEVVKSGVVKPQKASTKPGYKVKITRKKKPKTPTRKMERADHADSPATILIGRAHTRSVNSIGHVPKIVRNQVLKIDTDQNESFTGITELFNTPVNENQRKSTRLENKTATPKSSAAEVFVMKTPEESGEMVVSPINSPITTQRKKYSREAVSRLLRSPVSPQLLIGNEQMGTTAMPVVLESAAVETENTTRAKGSNVLKDKRKTIDLTGIKRIMKTPKQKRTPITDPVALKKLLRTPKQVESLPVIYTRRSSEFNQMVGVKRLLTTPKVRVPPVENLSGIKRIMKTPRQKGEPVEDMVGIKRIMRTPKQKGEPVEDMVGIKRIMRTPKQKGQPVDDMMGISHIMSTPPENTHPIEEIFGIKQLIKTPPKKSIRIEEVPAQENLTHTENNGPTGSLENLKGPRTTPRSGKGRLSRHPSGSLVTEEQQDTVTGELKTQPSPKSKKTPFKLSQPPADIIIKDHVNEQALPESNLQQEKSDDKQTPRSRSSRSTAFDLSTSELIGLENSKTRISEDSPQNTGLSNLGAPQASEPASSGLITSPKRKGRFSRGQTTALAPVGDDSTSSPPKQKDAPSNSLQKEVSLSVGSKELPIEKQPPCDALSDSEADKLGLSPRRGRLPMSSTKAPKESLSEPSKESLQDKSEFLDASLSTRSRGRKAGQRQKIIQDTKLANESDSKGKPVSKSELKKSKTSENAETPVPPELLQIEDLDAEAGAKKSTVAQRRMKRKMPVPPTLNPEEVSEQTEDSTDKNSSAGNTGSRRTGRNKKNDQAENKHSSGPEESHLQTRRRVLSKSKASQSPEPKSVTRSSRHQKEAVPDTNTELQSKTSRGRQTKNTRKDESPPEKPDEESTATENRPQLVRRGRFARVNKTVPNSEAISKEEITQNEVQQPSPSVSKNIRGRKIKEHINVALTEDKDNETEAIKETTAKKSTRGKKIIPQEMPKDLASEAVQNTAQLEEDGKRVQKERSSKAKSVQWHPLVVTQETSENEDAAQSTENETSTRGRSKGKNRREIEPTVSAKRSHRGKVEENSSLEGLVYTETNSSPEVKKSPVTTRSGKKVINKPTQVKNVQEVSSADSSIVPEILVQPVGLDVADEKEKSKKGKRGAKSSQQNLPSVSLSEANADSVTNKRGGRRVAASKGLGSDNKVDENAVSNKRGRRAANPSPPKVELKRSLVKKQEVAEDSISKSRRGVKRKINPEPVNESLNSIHTNDDLQSNKTNMDSVLSGRAKKTRNSSMQNEVADSPAKKKKTEAATATQKKEKSRSASKTEKEKAAKIPTRASTRSRK